MESENLLDSLPEGTIQLKDPNQIVYQMMVLPEVERIVNAEIKDQEDIENVLIELLDFFEDSGLGKDEVFKLIEILNKLSKETADKYLVQYEEIVNRL